MSKENVSMEIKSGLHNIYLGDGEIVDRDGRILNIETESYEKFVTKNGKLEKFESNILTDCMVVLVVWKYRISGTGRWAGKNMKEIKRQRPPPAGQTREIVFLWGGKNCQELEMGEAALLTTEMKLGTCFKIESDMEMEAFTKAWSGNLRIVDSTSNEADKLYLVDGQSKSGTFLRQVPKMSESLRPNSSFIVINDKEKVFIQNEHSKKCNHDELEKKLGLDLKQKFNFESLVPSTEITSNPESEKIEKIFKIEKNVDQLIPVQLKMSRPTCQNYKFSQAQLSGVCVLKTNNFVYLWHEDKQTEGISFLNYFIEYIKLVN